MVGAAVFATAVAARRCARLSSLLKRLELWSAWPDKEAFSKRIQQVGQALGASMALAPIKKRNNRSPGSRVMALERVDLRSGGPITVRSAIVRQLSFYGLREAFNSFQRAKLRPEATADDNRLATCGWGLLFAFVVHLLPPLLSRRHQSIPDRLAGIVTVTRPGPSRQH